MTLRFLHTLFGMLLLAESVSGQTVIIVNPVRAHSVITAADIDIADGIVAGTASDISQVIGLEARINLYPGRPIPLSEIAPPAILERNQTVQMVYTIGLLTITTEGRALDRAGIGERVRVMNMDSRMTVTGVVMPDGSVEVGP